MKIITPQVFGSMMLVSTIIADEMLIYKNEKYKKKHAYNTVQSCRNRINYLSLKDRDDEQIYDATDEFYSSFLLGLQATERIHVCRNVLGILLLNYAFNPIYKQIFKAIWKNSLMFAQEPKQFNYSLFEAKINKVSEDTTIDNLK